MVRTGSPFQINISDEMREKIEKQIHSSKLKIGQRKDKMHQIVVVVVRLEFFVID